jgi:hypothetical protein
MIDIGAKVYTLALNSSASHGDDDAHLEWIHSGQEVVRHEDYEIALKRILELQDKLDRIEDKVIELKEQITGAKGDHTIGNQ